MTNVITILSSTTADATSIACGKQGINNKQCAIVARYQEYIVSFSAAMNDKMTYEDFEKTVVYIASAGSFLA